MMKLLAKLALARLMGGRAGAFRPKGVKGYLLQALLRRIGRR